MNEFIKLLNREGVDFTMDGDNLSVGGYLDLQDCTGITALPGNLSVGGSLYLRGTGITALPDNLSVDGSLDMQDCTGITALPDNLSVGGYLDLSGTGITALPGNLSVGGSLDLQDCTGITALPGNLSVGGSLYLDAKRISNIAYRENCGYSSRMIFAAWSDNNFKIAAGCFFDTLDKFEQAVDEKYSGSAAEAYKQASRDCIAELMLKLNKEVS